MMGNSPQESDSREEITETPLVSGVERDESPDESEPTGRVEQAEDVASPTSVPLAHLKAVLESLIFVSDKPVTAVQLAKITKASLPQVRQLLLDLVGEYQGRGVELIEVGSGFQFRSCAANAPFVRDFVAHKPVRLSRAQLETLALVAYRQPVTRPEIDDVRGVDSGAALKILAERSLIKILGRKEEPGRPLLYGTTTYFLEFFGLRRLQDLPTLQEFTELSEESKALFQRKVGDPVLTRDDTTDDPADEPEDWSEEEASQGLDPG